LFSTGYKRIAEEGHKAFTFGFWLFEGEGFFDEGKCWREIAEWENELLKGKGLLKGNC
jgi:hypothetical protein